MAIKKRKTVPEPDLTQTASSHDDDGGSTARHPYLTGLRQSVYQYVRANPLCTRDDVARGIGLKSSTTTARIKELIDEGFIIEPGDKKRNASGVLSRCLIVSARPQGGKPLDKVRVEVVLTIDCNGVYGATAHVVGGLKQAERVQPIGGKRLTLTAPHPDTYKSAFAAENVSKISRMEAHSYDDVILDAEFIVLDD